MLAQEVLVIALVAIGGDGLVKCSHRSLGQFIFESGQYRVIPFVGGLVVIVGATAGHYRAGCGLQKPVVDVNLVRAEIDDWPPAQPAIPAPVAVLEHVFEAIFPKLGRSNGIFFRPSQVRLHRAVPLPVDGGDLAEQLVLFDQFLVGVNIVRIAAPLMAHLQQFAAAPHRANNPPRSFQGVGHFLFEIDIQPRLQAANRMVSMPEVRAGDDRGIEIFFGGEHLAVILISVQFVSVFLQQAIGAQLVVFGPDITHRPEAQTGDLQAGAEQHLPLGPGADQRDIQLGESLLLCSDGLCGLVKDEYIVEICRRYSGKEVVKRCVEAAKNAGGDDNISVVYIQSE